MAKVCRWRLQRKAEGVWRVGSAEGMGGSKPKLLELHKIANASNYKAAGAYARLRQLPEELQVNRLRPDVVPIARQRIKKLEERTDGDIATWVNTQQARLMVEDPSSLARTTRDVFGELLSTFPHSSVALLLQDRALTFRVAAARVLLLLDEDESLRHDVTSIEGTKGFASARHLFNSYQVGMQAYLAPLLLALSPFVFGFAVTRGSGVLLFDFGTAIWGRDPRVGGLIDLLAPARASGTMALESDELQPKAFRSAMEWWAARLNMMFSVISDPARFVDTNGNYDARRALSTMLSVEQLFTNVQALLAHDRDSHTRRLLCFDSLDTLEGLRALSFDEMTMAGRAERTVAELESEIPAPAKAVLLPRARAAVQALKDMQRGFFLQARLRDDGISLPGKSGTKEVCSLASAVRMYLRVLRNAGHGFGGKHDAGRMRDEALLASHTGEIPHGLADLAYLYLLRFLVFPR